MIGRMTIGIQASGPATMNRTAMKTIANKQIGDRNHRSGREELANRIEIPQLIGEHADRWRAGRQLHRLHMLEYLRGEHDVDLLAGDVDDAAAHHAQHEIEDDRDDHADRKRNERRDRAVRHDAIVDVHREDRRAEREQIDDQRRDRDVAVVLPESLGDGPEPVRLRRCSAGYAVVGLRGRANEECIAEVILRVGADATPGVGEVRDGSMTFGVGAAAGQDARRAVLHDQNGGQEPAPGYPSVRA